MRIAAISDIHGNLPALDAVLADIAAIGVDVTVNLGDIVSGPLWPAETLARLAPLALPTIAGNHERQVLAEDTAAMGASDAFAAARLSADDRAWLRALPPTRWLAEDLLLCHGTPTSDLVYWLETLDAAHPSGIRAATLDEIRARIAPGAVDRATLVLCGHTHVPRVVACAPGLVIVNPGSVGVQAYEDADPPHRIELGTPHARYAIVERTADGWRATPRAIPYDWATSAARAARGNRPEWARALETGRIASP
ncbi:MAG: metallophosphatase family protein [Deltaproteobacteria bacterium]|nr:metallophosphatase family protein [Deltaproteobacteria bacterium]